MKNIATFAIAIAVAAALPLAAQNDAPKNVQLLKGLTPMQLDRTMEFIRASLGVNCFYCHVGGEGQKWDPASDDKPAKVTARKMIGMTMEMNAKFFEGRTEVTCNSCHRGSTRPVAQPILPQARPAQTVPKPERPVLPSRDEVVAKYAAAVGKIDEKKLENVAMKGTRESSDGKSVDVQYVQHSDKIVVTTADRTQEITPTAGVVRDKDGDHPIDAGQLEYYKEQIEAFRFIMPRDIPSDARVIRKEKIDDHETYVVRGRKTLFYFDTQSGLLLRRVTFMDTPVGAAPLRTNYSDYREVDGMKLPFTLSLESVDPFIELTRKYSEIHVGVKSD